MYKSCDCSTDHLCPASPDSQLSTELTSADPRASAAYSQNTVTMMVSCFQNKSHQCQLTYRLSQTCPTTNYNTARKCISLVYLLLYFLCNLDVLTINY